MPKVTKIENRGSGGAIPLRVTERKGRPLQNGDRQMSSKLVRCGCCEERLVIFFDNEPSDNPHQDTLEINGVSGTLDQWRQLLCPLLGLKVWA
jgi:hypothetical protein